MNKIKFSVISLSLMIFTFTSCKKDDAVTVETENYKGIVVINEGGFNKSNGSVGIYKPGTKTYFDAFKKANDRPLGDVVQSISDINDKYFIVVNNSNKIEVVNKVDFKSVAVISTSSPRYVLKVSTDKAYISNYSSNTVKILNLKTNSINGNIDVQSSSDQMALLGSKVYVATLANKIKVIKVDSDSLKDSLITSSGLNKVINFGSNRLAILCTGTVDWSSGAVIENGKICFLQKDSSKFEREITLSTGSYGGSLIYNASSGYLYYSLGNNVIKKVDNTGNVTDFVTLPGTGSVYGLSVGKNGEIMVTDAGDFNSNGKVYIYSTDGVKISEFSAGIAPNAAFNNE